MRMGRTATPASSHNSEQYRLWGRVGLRPTVDATFVALALGQRVSSMRLVAAAACLGAAGVLAACGGGGTSSSSPSTTAAPVGLERAVGSLQSSRLGVCQTTHGGLAPGITVQATSRLDLDCRRSTRAISIYAFDDPNVAFAVAGGGVARGDDVWLVGDLTVAGAGLTGAQASTFDQTMRSLGAHRYQGA